MICEIIGSALVVASSTAIGIQKGNKYKNRVELLKQFRNTVQMLETEIFYTSNPLPIAFESIANKTDSSIGKFYKSLSDGLYNIEYLSIYEAINDKVDKTLKGLVFQRTDLDLIRGLGNVLGASDREDQIKHLKLFNVQLEQQINVAEDSRKTNEKIYKNMGFIIGIGISLVLV